MLREFVDERVEPVLGSERYRRVLASSLVVLALVFSETTLITNLLGEVTLFTLSSSDASVALLVAFGLSLVYLEFLVSRSNEFTDRIETLDGRVSDVSTQVADVEEHIVDADVMQGDSGVHDELADFVEPESTVWLLHYSSNQAEEVVEEAIDQQCEVYLLLKHPSEAINSQQSKRIINTLTNRFNIIGEYERLNIRFYREPASIRGTKFDNEALCLGWYTFVDEPKIIGHKNPVVTFTKYNEGYEEVNTFFEERFRTLWQQSETFEDLFDRRRDTDQDWARELTEWYTMVEADRRSKKEWIRTASDHGADPFVERRHDDEPAELGRPPTGA